MLPARFRSLAIAVLVGVGASASVAASASAGGIPARTVTYQGLRVTVPGAEAEMLVRSNGSRIGIRVVSFGKQPRSRPSARITVTRTAPGEKPVEKTIVRKTLRKGQVHFPLTAAPGFAYRIQVQIGKRRWTTRLRTSNEVTVAIPSPTTATCNPSGTLKAESPSAVVGGVLMLRITNTSKSVLVFGADNGWSQLSEGGWVNVLSVGGENGLPPGLEEPPSWTVAPGETRYTSGMVWASLVPGTYRMTQLVSCASKNPDGSIRFDTTTLTTEPVTVTPASGL